MRATLLLAALVLAPLASLAPAADAQAPGIVSPSFNVFSEDPGRALGPGAVEPISVVVNYAPGQGGRPTPAPTPDRPEGTQPTRVTFAVKTQPTWVTAVTFEPAEVFFHLPVENVSATNSRRVSALVTVADDAPALERESFVVVATAEPNGNIQGATAESPDLKLRAATVGKLNVTSDPRAVLPGGRWTVVPYTVTNEGNSEIVAKINVTVRPENSQVEFVDTLQLARGASETVEVRVRTPWVAAEFGSLELEAVPIIDGEEGTPARAEVEVFGQSAVPGAGAVAILVVLSVLAAAWPRKK